MQRELSANEGQLLTLGGDSTSPKQMSTSAQKSLEHFGEVHNVVYCAGAYRAQRPTLEIDSDEWDLILDSNLKGAFVTYQAFLPHIANAGGGAVVSISSLAGRTSSPFLGCRYSAAKAGVLGLMRHIAREFGPQGIRANSTALVGPDASFIKERIESSGYRVLGLIRIAAQTRHKDLNVLVNRYIRPLEALATTSSKDLGL